MRTLLKNFILGIPVIAFLTFPAVTMAHDDSRHKRFHGYLANDHRRQHDRLDALHDRYHRNPHSRYSHRRFHRWLERKHRSGHRERAAFHEYFHDRYRRYNDRNDHGKRKHQGYGRRGPNRHDWSHTPRYNDRHHDHSHD